VPEQIEGNKLIKLQKTQSHYSNFCEDFDTEVKDLLLDDK